MEEFDYFLTNPIVSQPFLQFTAHYKAARLTPGLWTHNFVLGTVDSEVWMFHLSELTYQKGQPHGRTISLHTFDERGFCFCSNYDGPKATQLGNWHNLFSDFSRVLSKSFNAFCLGRIKDDSSCLW